MSANWSGLSNAISQFGAQRRQRADTEFRDQAGPILEDVKKLQERRSTLPEGDPGLKEIDDSLAEHQRVFQELSQHHKVSPDTIAGLMSSAAGTQPKDPYLTPDDLKKKARIAAGLDPRAVPEKSESENWVPQNVKFADGTEATLQRNSKDGRWTDLAGKPVPPERLATAAITPKPTAGSNSKFSQEAGVYESKWGKKIKDWTPEELSYFNQKMAYDSQHSGQSTSTRLEKDENGVIHPVEVVNTRSPMRPPVDPHESKPATPVTPGAAKHKIASAAAPKSNVREGAPLSFKGSTPATTKARNDVTEATKLSSVADQVAQHPDDAVNQKRLAVALERASAGRFTTQALDYIIKAGWGNTIEQWANNPSTGALPTDIMRQLVDGAHQNLKGAQDALATAEGGSSGSTAPSGAKEIHYKIVNGQLVAQ